MTRYDVEPGDGLILSILVLYLGMWLSRRIKLLRDNHIPPAVTGGLICSCVVWAVYSMGDVEIHFDMRIRDILLLVFFSTIGLSAKLRTLAAGGKALAILVVVAAVFLVVQDATGVGLAYLFGAHPGYGLLGGSVSFAGGHGTAIAWGAEAEAAGLTGASEIGIAFATFGLIVGGLIGGPIARRLISRNQLVPGSGGSQDTTTTRDEDDDNKAADLFTILGGILALAICVEVGDLVNRVLFSRGVLLPGFLTAMLVGILITNLADVANKKVHTPAIGRAGEVSLNIFLSMSLMSMQLWTLAGSAGPIIIVLLVQTLVMTLFASLVVFRVSGRDYDASVISAGFAGLGLGATPVAIANMDAVTRRYAPSPKAFLVIPLVGAFFIDLLNAIVIKFFIRLIA